MNLALRIVKSLIESKERPVLFDSTYVDFISNLFVIATDSHPLNKPNVNITNLGEFTSI